MKIENSYNPKSFEDKLYKEWENKGYFEANPNPKKKPFTIVIPPPNITGQLHMGHALNNTIQDAIIRFKRMQGYEALWLPGTDHASIATEVKIVEQMAKEGLTKKDVGRDSFLERAWKWKDKYGGRIVEQLKKLGSSCDWSKLAFTMDERCSVAVKEVFVNLYKKGLIYQGDRIINWCPKCKTAISDAEVEYSEKQGNFWHIMYEVVGSKGKEFVIVATTRPETMLGDTAVAVNPNDKRYKKLVGKKLILPLMNKEIPIVADDYVDAEFGTGAVKITPAHDPNDFEVGLRHNLEVIRVMDDSGVMNEKAGKYQGLDRFEARKKIVADLKELGLLEKIQEHNHNVGECYRCRTIIEPIVSKQWFVKMKPLAEPAVEVVKNDEVKFLPKRFEKIYFNWMENIKDWCISRQLWWGHRIPAYYCEECGHTMVETVEPKECAKCKSKKLKQDEDVLDTWFSSALWPFSTLGYPQKTKELEYFYPTNVLVTAYDIIFFWVARMIFSGLEHMNKIPFDDVLITGLVRDAEGKKMSKSLGNGIDPLEIIDEYGADTLRFNLVYGVATGSDTRFIREKLEGVKNFMNKVWNASKFVSMHSDGVKLKPIEKCELTLADKWILNKLNTTIKEVTASMEKYELGIATTKLYDFVWNEFCDWYIELVKPVLYLNDIEKKIDTISVLSYVLEMTLKLLHPFVPFITEEIFTTLNNNAKTIMLESYPTKNDAFEFEAESALMQGIMEIISKIRNLRLEMNVANSKKINLFVKALKNKNELEKARVYLEKLANAESVKLVDDVSGLGDKLSQVVTEIAEIYIPLGDLVDFEKEKLRLTQEKQKFESELQRAVGKLNNQGFVAKAPESLIDEEKAKVEKYKDLISKLNERINELN